MTLKNKLTACLLAALLAAQLSGGAAEAASAEGKMDIKARIAALLNKGVQKEEAPQQITVREEMERLEVDSRDEGGTLIFSDSPEYVTEPGILYRDTVEGASRVLYYHLNNTAEPQKVAVVLESEAASGISIVRVSRGGFGTPSDDYLAVGKETQKIYFGERREGVVALVGQSARLLDARMDETVLQPGELVYGVYDFSTETKTRVTVCMYPALQGFQEFLKGAHVLPKDEVRLRGTFKGMNRVLTSKEPYNADEGGMRYLPLADDHFDQYRTGVDATDGEEALNYGNYGILYKINIATTGETPVRYYLAPLGGVYAGAVSVRRDHSISTKMIETPEGAYFGHHTSSEAADAALGDGTHATFTDGLELADLGSYDSYVSTTFEFSPPGASNLPAYLILKSEK